MKKNILSLILFSVVNAFCQTPQNLYKGVWSTVNSNKTTIINNSSSVGGIFRISNGTLNSDNIFDDFTIVVDGIELSKRFMEGGGVVVEGKRIELRQNGVSNVAIGVWEIIQKIAVETVSSIWAIKPEPNKEFLVAELKNSQEFQFVVNGQPQGCSQNFVEVAVDGNTIKDKDGRPINFALSSSFLGEGKRITIKASGTCSVNNFISGSLLLKK
ncbi:hypothetical protein [Flavobacterium sp.]|uniref:hypothetical protein n=1 Tax=Flavobacterium sp. TaxID=239 RepID=UPI0025BCFEAD|nr:hypothetical protein [Flavobacterium sp.]